MIAKLLLKLNFDKNNKQIIYFILYLLVLFSIFKVLGFVLRGYLCFYYDNHLILELIKYFTLFSFTVVITEKIPYFRLNKIPRKKKKGGFLLYLPFIILLFGVPKFINFIISNNISILNIFLYFFLRIFQVLLEEYLFRYKFFNLLDKSKNTLFSIIGSSLIFGLLHLANLTEGYNIMSIISQSIFAFGIGYLLCSIYVITNKLIYPILWHLLFNFLFSLNKFQSKSSNITEFTYLDNFISLVIIVLLSLFTIVYSHLLLRKYSIIDN